LLHGSDPGGVPVEETISAGGDADGGALKARSLFAAFALPITAVHAQATWTVDIAKPVLDVRGLAADGSVNFNVPAGATRLSNGSLLLADRAAFTVRLFDASGKLVKTTGRRGEGPNEFRSLYLASPCGPDTLLAWDSSIGTASMIGASGTIGRQVHIPAGTGVPEPNGPFACTRGGRIAYANSSMGRSSRSTPGHSVRLGSVVVVDREGRKLAQADSLFGIETVAVANGGAIQQPLGRMAYATGVSEDIVFGSSDTTIVTALHRNGTRATIDLPIKRRAPTREEFETAAGLMFSGMPKARRDQFLQLLLATPMPERLPAYTALFGDPTGLLWAQLSPPGANSTELAAYRLDGRQAAHVTIPLAATIYEIGRDYILASYSDADDEVHVAVLRLNRK
jgi:hypothetical protein